MLPARRHPAALRARAVLVPALAAALLAACGSGGSDEGSGAPDPAAAAGGSSSSSAGGAPSSPGRSSSAGTPGEPITIAFGGDVHFEGASRAALSGGLRAITPVLSAADLTVVNLETAVTSGGTPASKQYVFRAPASAFGALRDAGVDVVTMANNHGMDYGVTGLRDSLAAAQAAGFPVVGIGLDEDAAFAPHYAQVKGSTVAVIGATQVLDANLITAWTAGPGKPGLASAKDEDRLVQAVEQARGKADTVVVDLHWGQEQDSCPLDRQQSLARRLADAGADVVVGSHAHVLLGGGYLGRTYVDYGLGNFVFYARGGAGAETGVLTVQVRGRDVGPATWRPARISGGVPSPLSGDSAARASAAWERLRGCTGLSDQPS